MLKGAWLIKQRCRNPGFPQHKNSNSRKMQGKSYLPEIIFLAAWSRSGWNFNNPLRRFSPLDHWKLVHEKENHPARLFHALPFSYPRWKGGNIPPLSHDRDTAFILITFPTVLLNCPVFQDTPHQNCLLAWVIYDPNESSCSLKYETEK